MAGKERAGYTVTMFVVDVSPSMGHLRTVQLTPGPNDEKRTIQLTNLQWALKYVEHKAQQMIFTGRLTDQIGIILVGTEGTNNPVSDIHGGYDHVTEYLPIHKPNARTLQKIDSLQPSSEIGDPIDGIIVALFAQQQHLEKKRTWTRKLVLITDGENPLELDDDDLSGTIHKIIEYNVDMTIIGVDFDDEELPYEEPNKSKIKRVNEELYHKIVEQLENGRVGTCEYALRVCAEPEIKVTKSTLSRTTMIIGDIQTRMDDAISIPVRTGKATAIVRPQSFKKFSRRTGSAWHDTRLEKSLGGLADKLSNGAMSAPWEDIAPLAMRTEFILAPQSKENEDEAAENEDGDREDASEHFQDQQRVEKEDLTKSYKYGSTWIPIEDLSENYLPTQQGLELVGFSYEDMWTRDWSMDEVYYIFADNASPRAQVAFSSLVQAMHNYQVPDKSNKGSMISKPVLAIIRKVTRDDSPPKMGVACARSIDQIDYLVWVRMPFAEDLRRFSFASLDIIKDRKGVQKTTHPLLPTPSMMSAMDKLVDSYDLSDAGPKDEDGNCPPWFDPTEAVSPAVHRIKEAMLHAAITTDITKDPVPPPHPEITKFFERPRRVVSRSQSAVAECQAVFNVSKVPPKVKFRKRKNVDGLDEDADVPLTLTDLMNGDAFVSTAVQSPGPSHVSTTTVASLSHPKSAPSNSDTSEPMEIDQKPDLHPMIVGQGAKPGRIIGNDHPLYDFKSNIARGDVVTKAVADLGQVIPEVVAESFSSQRFDEALECMKAMRDVALQEDEVDEWNSFLRGFKKLCRKSGFKHPDFWEHVKAVGSSLSLIHEAEAEEHGATSDVSQSGSERFIKD